MSAGESFSEHVARLERLGRTLRVGSRVRVIISGRTGTIVGPKIRHNGWLVEWDEPMFGVERGRVLDSQIDVEAQS